MQLPTLFFFAFFISLVASKGVRNGFERVWLWNAYQLDLELPEAQRKIGIRCRKWDDTVKLEFQKCPDKVPKLKKGKPVVPEVLLDNPSEPCKGSRPDKSCYFWEFMGHIDGKPDGKPYDPKKTWLLPTDVNNPNLNDQKNLNPNPRLAAEWMSIPHGNTVSEKEFNPARSVAYRPWRVFNTPAVGENYNLMLSAVGQHSATTITGLSAAQKAAHATTLTNLKESLRSAIIEREINHAPYVKSAAADNGFDLRMRTEPGFVGDIVDWVKTKEVNTPEAFNKFYNGYYDSGDASKVAKEHLQVMEDFRAVQAGYSACGI
ncbi:hypothetical protein BKA61DRAFT_704846 [Leptodontidium sp. MPI-SDFR-AT-0119]|nr:hypothetical protein BKA61DRAFT_704846 [Leptodontidium sp. MPI-SDFR-AT-0119]